MTRSRASTSSSRKRRSSSEAGTGRGGARLSDVLLLQALAHIIADDRLRERFLALTGFDPATLRARAGEPDVLDAVAGFLEGHEPDLLAVAAALGVEPGALCARS
ncbi:MAG: DUF3572 family protein [Sphingomonadaceae bacterium]